MKKRVLIVSENFPPKEGGCSSKAFDLARVFSRFSEVFVLTCPVEKKISPRGFSVFYFANSFKSVFSLVYFPFFFLKTVSLIRRNKIDVVLATSPPISLCFAAYFASVFFPKTRFVLDMRDYWYALLSTYKRLDPRIFLVRWLEAFCARRADLVSVVTDGLYKIVLGMGVEASKIVLVPNGAFSEKMRRGKKKNLVSFVGMFYHFRDFSVLSEALGDESFSFVFAGEGPVKKDFLENVVGREKKNVSVLPLVSKQKALEIASESWAGLVPVSKTEATSFQIPLKVYEYMAQGVPVLAWGPEGDLKSFLEKNRIGLWVDSPESLLDALKKLRKNEKLYRELSANSSRLSKKFDRERLLEGFFTKIRALFK